MSSESSVHSNAFNFMSFMETGVDPRTGQYTATIKLPDLGANFLQGPAFVLKLNFNPLNRIDSGWGKGWNLALTQYADHNKVITTYTGESFKVEGSSGDRLHMPEQKLAHFHLYHEPPGHNREPRFRVVHRSGLVEILEMMGSQQGRIALPVEVYSPLGHKLSLAYQPFNPSYMRLQQIRDGRGDILLEVRDENGDIALLERPYLGANGKPIARYVMKLQETDRRVASISLPSPDQGSWRFVYRDVLEHLCISEARTPTGVREYLQYNDGGHQFPVGSRRLPLPRVTRHIVEPGSGQPSFQTLYSYPGDKNFLGHGATIPWSDDGRDNLYKHTGDYQYQTVATLCDIDERPLQVVTRAFNRFHLPSLIQTRRNASVHEVITRYQMTDNLPFEQQVSTLQLPIEEQTRWSQDGHSPANREQRTQTRYDSHGNTVWQQSAEGVVEESTWYGIAGEDGYPGDPYGFVRHLKSRVTIPAQGGAQPAPRIELRYRYRALPALAGHTTQLKPWLVEHSETELHEQTVVRQTINSYVDAPALELLHGRRYRQVRKFGTLETATEVQVRTLLDPLSQHPVVELTTTTHGYDGTEQATVERRSLLLGETVFEQDENGVQIQREHDALRRVTLERVAPGTPFEASRHYAYSLCARDGDIASQQVRNARNISTRAELDGLGRVTRESRDNVHPARPATFLQTLALRYNEHGDRVEQTQTDWLEGEQLLTLTTAYRHDDWGQLCCTIDPDGVEEHNHLDPIGSSRHPGPVRQQWRQSSAATRQTTDAARQISDKRETWLNLFDKPVRIQRLNALGVLMGERTYHYDGLGRSVSETDERRHTTTFGYDGWGRMCSTLLPDGTRLTRGYAGHTHEELPNRLLVTPANTTLPAREIGAQSFDGLNRLISATAGNRTEYFQFEGGELQPRRRLTPAGDTINLDYNLHLSTEPTSSIAPDDPASFDYHKVSARLHSSTNLQGKHRFDYNSANQLIAEHWDDRNGKTWSRTLLSSVGDRLKRSTEDNGIDTVHDYDAYGRLTSTQQGQLQASCHYDELGRVTRMVSRDSATGSALETLIEHDDHDRERKRTWRQAGQAERTLELGWGEDDLLQWRELREDGNLLLAETFEYDPRARLLKYVCEGPERPVDALGRQLATQVFGFDAYDNITQTTTSFAAGPRPERAQFHHTGSDPCQLQGITYTPARSTGNPVFRYDANGNLTQDQRGRHLLHDSQNRLIAIDNPDQRYRYDATGRLVASALGADPETVLLHDGLKLRLAIREGLQTLYLHHGEQPLGLQQIGAAAEPALLLQTSASRSVLAESQGSERRTSRYTVYGERHDEAPVHSALGFNGEVLDPVSGCYLLGNGNRVYDPQLMRFQSPDSYGPFDAAAGINYYTYCQGNPVTFRDPTGHYSIGYSGTSRSLEDMESHRISPRVALGALGWVGMGFGFLFAGIASAVAIVMTAGIAAPAVAAAWSAAGGGLAGASAALTAGMGAVAGVSLATGIKLGAAVLGAALTVTGTALNTEGVLSGNEERANAGMILNYAAAVVGLATVGAGYALGRLVKISKEAATPSVLLARTQNATHQLPNPSQKSFLFDSWLKRTPHVRHTANTPDRSVYLRS